MGKETAAVLAAWDEGGRRWRCWGSVWGGFRGAGGPRGSVCGRRAVVRS